MTQALQNNLISTLQVALPCDSVPLVMELVKKLGGEVLEASSGDYISPPIAERERIGRMVKGLRLRAGMTQKQLAKAIDVPQSHISQYEGNLRPIPEQKAKELARVLDSVDTHFLPR